MARIRRTAQEVDALMDRVENYEKQGMTVPWIAKELGVRTNWIYSNKKARRLGASRIRKVRIGADSPKVIDLPTEHLSPASRLMLFVGTPADLAELSRRLA